MEFEFDADKNEQNLLMHGIDLIDAQKLWVNDHVIVPAKNVKGEQRSAILGKINHKTFVAIFAERTNKIRLISCHRADKKLERVYDACFKN